MFKPASEKLMKFLRPQPPFFWLVVCAGVITCLLFAVNGIVGYRYSRYDKFGYTVEAQSNGIVVIKVDAAGPANGKLQVGDRVLSLNGPAGEVPVQWHRTILYTLYHAPAGTPYSLRIVRQGSALTIPLELQLYLVPEVGERWRGIFSALLSSLPFAIVALLVGLLRPNDPTARRAFFAMLCFALNFCFSGVIDNFPHLLSGSWLALWWLHLVLSGGTLYVALAYNLYYQFPAGALPGRVWAWLKWLLLGAVRRST
jgi:hypothetical protein